MEKTHELKIDLVRVEDPKWNIVVKWTQRKVFAAMVHFLMDGFKIPRSKKKEDNHQVISVLGDEKFCTDAYEKITNSEVNKLKDMAYSLRKVLPKNLRNQLATADFREEKKVWTRVVTMLGIMGIHISVSVEKYLNTNTQE